MYCVFLAVFLLHMALYWLYIIINASNYVTGWPDYTLNYIFMRGTAYFFIVCRFLQMLIVVYSVAF